MPSTLSSYRNSTIIGKTLKYRVYFGNAKSARDGTPQNKPLSKTLRNCARPKRGLKFTIRKKFSADAQAGIGY